MNKGFIPPPHPACPPDRAAGTLQRGVRPSPKGRHTKSCGGQRHESDNEKIRFVVISPHPVVISGRTRVVGMPLRLRRRLLPPAIPLSAPPCLRRFANLQADG